MNAAEIIEKLEAYGYQVALLPEDKVSLKFPPGRSKPDDAEALVDQCKVMKKRIVFYLKARADGFKPLPIHSIRYDNYREAINAFNPAMARDEVEIIKVLLYRKTGEVEVQFRLLV